MKPETYLKISSPNSMKSIFSITKKKTKHKKKAHTDRTVEL